MFSPKDNARYNNLPATPLNRKNGLYREIAWIISHIEMICLFEIDS